MISDTRPQNAIVVITIIAGIIGATSLYSAASYYGGSYVLVQRLDVELTEMRLGNFDPLNMSVDPALSAFFQFTAPEIASGKTRLESLTASIYLNGESFNYANFRRNIPAEDKLVTSGYNKTFSVGSTLELDQDKQLIYDAYIAEDWTFSVTLSIFYTVFESRAQSVRVMTFVYSANFTF